MIRIGKIDKWPAEIGAGYWFDADGTLLYKTVTVDKQGAVTAENTEQIANFTPILKEQRRIDNGVEVSECLVFQAFRNGQLEPEVYTDSAGILGQTPQAIFGAACRVYIGKLHVARLREVMQIQCERASRTTIYQHTGYQVIDGKRVFLNGDNSVTAEGLTDKYTVNTEGQLSNYRFLTGKNDQRFETLISGLPKVAPRRVILTGLGLSFLTPLNALLREEGIEPNFIIYFTGKTGTRKTTMAKLFLNFFGTFDNGTASPAGFRDTPNALEKKFALTDSTLVLLDDRIPSTSTSVKTQMEATEQNAARQIGDRSSRARMNRDGSLRPVYRPKCNLIITAEESFSNVGESAIARALQVDFKPGDIKLDALTDVQSKAYHLNQIMSEYIQFVLKNWEELKAELKPLFLELRNQAQTGTHGRLAESVSHLQIGIIVMCRWLVSIGMIDPIEADQLTNVAWRVFGEIATDQNKRITEEKPVKLFLDAVRELYVRKAIRFIYLNGNETSSYFSARDMGYRDDEYFYVTSSQQIYTAVRRFYEEQGQTFPVGRSTLLQQLRDDGLILPDKSQCTKLKTICGETRRYLWIKANAIEQEEQ